MSASLRSRLGRACWLLQPLSIVVEFVAAAYVQAPYDFLDNTISDLGATTCGTVPYPGVDVAVCSPAHALVNGSFVLGGLLLIAGTILLWPKLAGSPGAVVALVLWIVAGLSAALTGLLPLDRFLELHALASLPGIVVQPAAFGLLALGLARQGRPLWWVGVGVAAVSFVVAVVFVLRLDPQWGGLLERIAIWPCLVALPFLAPSPRRADLRRR